MCSCVCGCELSCVGVLLRLNFWFFSGNCRPCLRVVQLPERTTGPTSQETPTTLPAGNEGSQAYSGSWYPVCSQGSTAPRTTWANPEKPHHPACLRQGGVPCLRVMKTPRPTLLLRGTVKPCLRVVQVPERTTWPSSGRPHDPACG